MKKIVSLFLALVMLVSTVAVNAFADTPNLSMSVDKSVVSEGENVEITVSIKATTVSSLAGTFSFDKDAFECVSIMGEKNGSAHTNAYLKNDEDDNIAATALSTIEEANSSGNVGVAFAGTKDVNYLAGVVFKVTLKAKTAKATEFKLYEDSAGTNGYIADTAQTQAITIKGAPKPVTGVTVAPTTASLKVGAEQQLTATVTPSDADNKTVTWKSSNPSVATVDGSGKVKAVAAGTANITATAGGVTSAPCVVTVTNVALTKIEITTQPTTNAFDVGATEPNWKTSGLKVKATYDDESVNENFTDYTVSGWNSATAQEITLTVNAGGKTATFKVTIQKITLQASDFLVTNNTYAFDNKPHQATVTCKKTGVTPVITYKQGENVVAEPKEVGTYDVYVSFAGNDKYNAFAAAKVGTLTIAECEHAFKWEKVANTTKGLVSQYQEVCEKCESIGKSEYRMELPIEVIVKAEKGTPGSKSFEVQYGTEKMTVATNGAKTYPAIITVKADTMDSLMEKLLRTEMVVKQTTADGDNWKIDKTVYTVTFEVENSGNVNATITAPVEIEEKIIDNDGKETTIKETEIKNFERVSFTNIYSGKTGGRNPSSSSSNKTVESQKTFDAGIALYAGMALLSLTGGAWMIGKKKEH